MLLLEFGGNGHNDALMLTLLLAALIPIARLTANASAERRGRLEWAAGMLLLTLSALVKYATLLVGVFATVEWARELRDRRARLFWIGGTLVAAALVAVAMYWPWYAGPRMLGPAVDEINGAGGVKGKPIKVLYEDDKSNPNEATNKVLQLITRDKVLAILSAQNRVLSDLARNGDTILAPLARDRAKVAEDVAEQFR